MTSVVSSSRRVVAHSHARSCRAAASRSSSFSHLFRDHGAPREANVWIEGSSEEDARRLTVVRKMLRDFEKRWKFTQRGCGAGCAAWLRRAVCGCMCGGETDEERLERIVRAKVLRTVHSIILYFVTLHYVTHKAKVLRTVHTLGRTVVTFFRPTPRAQNPPGVGRAVARGSDGVRGRARVCADLFATRHRRLV